MLTWSHSSCELHKKKKSWLICRGEITYCKKICVISNGNTQLDSERGLYRAHSFTWRASMQIYGSKINFLHKKRVQLPPDLFGTPIWPPFHCFGTPIWLPWRHCFSSFLFLAARRDGCIRKTWRRNLFFNMGILSPASRGFLSPFG